MENVFIVVETPAGSRAKYKYSKAEGYYHVKKLLPAGMMFPYDFGFIPGTKGDDEDPIDAMIISEFSSFAGCRIECRFIGVLEARQKEKTKTVENDRYFFVPTVSLLFKKIKNLSELSSDHITQLKEFFINYNRAEGKEFIPGSILSASKAWKKLNINKT